MGTVEFEDGLWIVNQLIVQMTALYLGFYQGQCAHPDSSREHTEFKSAESGCLVLGQAKDTQSPLVAIRPRTANRRR